MLTLPLATTFASAADMALPFTVRLPVPLAANADSAAVTELVIVLAPVLAMPTNGNISQLAAIEMVPALMLTVSPAPTVRLVS